MFDGPTNCQRVLVASGSASACAAARLICACVTGLSADAARSRNDCGPSDSVVGPLHGAGAAAARTEAFLGVTDVVVATATTTSTPATSSTTRLTALPPF